MTAKEYLKEVFKFDLGQSEKIVIIKLMEEYAELKVKEEIEKFYNWLDEKNCIGDTWMTAKYYIEKYLTNKQ